MLQTRVYRGIWFALIVSLVFCRPILLPFHDVCNCELRIVEQVARGGTSTKPTETATSDQARHHYILSFLSAFRVLHKKRMRATQEVSDDNMRRVIEIRRGNDDAPGDGYLFDTNTEDEKRAVEDEQGGGGSIPECESPSDNTPKSTPRQMEDKGNTSRSNYYSASSARQVEMSTSGVLGRRRVDDAVPELNVVVGTNEANVTVAKLYNDPLVDNHSALKNESLFISSGYWESIDKVLSLGLSTTFISLRISRQLRPLRKVVAEITGLHGLVSLKEKKPTSVSNQHINQTFTVEAADELMPVHENGTQSVATGRKVPEKLRRGERIRRLTRSLVFSRRGKISVNCSTLEETYLIGTSSSEDLRNSERIKSSKQPTSMMVDEVRRAERVKEIDRIISRVQKEVVELQCEKDDLQERPNPLYNYSSITRDTSEQMQSTSHERAVYLTNRTSRTFNFPPPDLAKDYIDDLVDSGRLNMLNHTHLWQSRSKYGDDSDSNDEEEQLTDDATLQDDFGSRGSGGESLVTGKRNRSDRSTSGSWLLRQSLGRGLSLGEKIGETIELAAYKAVCSSVMSILARSVSALHGVNVMTHSDIRLYVEAAPDLPPLGKGGLSDGDKYAEEAIRKAIRRSAKKRKKQKYHGQNLHHFSNGSDDAFLQRDAVIETLISHCQISAPLLKLFPLSWQRALLGNIITLVAALISDFADGIQIHILGHQLSLSFKPITELDMMNQIAPNSRRHRARVDKFEAAVQATAHDVSESLEFLDKWHERALGSGMLRTQIGSMVARVVLTLVDDVLAACKFDLWSAQTGGRRAFLELEPRSGLFPGEDAAMK